MEHKFPLSELKDLVQEQIDKMNDWEKNFVKSFTIFIKNVYVDGNVMVSDKQLACLNKIKVKVYGKNKVTQ